MSNPYNIPSDPASPSYYSQNDVKFDPHLIQDQLECQAASRFDCSISSSTRYQPVSLSPTFNPQNDPYTSSFDPSALHEQHMYNDSFGYQQPANQSSLSTSFDPTTAQLERLSLGTTQQSVHSQQHSQSTFTQPSVPTTDQLTPSNTNGYDLNLMNQTMLNMMGTLFNNAKSISPQSQNQNEQQQIISPTSHDREHEHEYERQSISKPRGKAVTKRKSPLLDNSEDNINDTDTSDQKEKTSSKQLKQLTTSRRSVRKSNVNNDDKQNSDLTASNSGLQIAEKRSSTRRNVANSTQAPSQFSTTFPQSHSNSKPAQTIESDEDDDEFDDIQGTGDGKTQVSRKEKLAKKAERARILRRERLDRLESLEKETSLFKTQILEYELALQQQRFFYNQSQQSVFYYQTVIAKYQEKYGSLDPLETAAIQQSAEELSTNNIPFVQLHSMSFQTATQRDYAAKFDNSFDPKSQLQENSPMETFHTASMNDLMQTNSSTTTASRAQNTTATSLSPQLDAKSTNILYGQDTAPDGMGLLGSLSNSNLNQNINNINLSAFSLLDSKLPTSPNDPISLAVPANFTPTITPPTILTSSTGVVPDLSAISYRPSENHQHSTLPSLPAEGHSHLRCPGGNTIKLEPKEDNVLLVLRDQLTKTAHGLLGSIALINDAITVREHEKHLRLLQQQPQ